MNDENLKNLLEKYWNAETTLEEEKQILEYMENQDLADEFAQEKELFSLFDAARTTDYFPSRIKYPRGSEDKGGGGLLTMFITPMRYAAVFLLGACCLWLITQFRTADQIDFAQIQTNHEFQQVNFQNIEDPQEAAIITREALMMVSDKLNRGKQETKKTLAAFNGINIMEFDPGY